MPYELAGFLLGAGETHSLDHIVNASLQELQEVVARDPLHPLGLLKIAAELALQNTVDTPYLLLLPQLQTIF
jgi:hypothetical protein